MSAAETLRWAQEFADGKLRRSERGPNWVGIWLFRETEVGEGLIFDYRDALDILRHTEALVARTSPRAASEPFSGCARIMTNRHWPRVDIAVCDRDGVEICADRSLGGGSWETFDAADSGLLASALLAQCNGWPVPRIE